MTSYEGYLSIQSNPAPRAKYPEVRPSVGGGSGVSRCQLACVIAGSRGFGARFPGVRASFVSLQVTESDFPRAGLFSSRWQLPPALPGCITHFKVHETEKKLIFGGGGAGGARKHNAPNFLAPIRGHRRLLFTAPIVVDPQIRIARPA